jgi:two-component system LytT family sensor kinase
MLYMLVLFVLLFFNFQLLCLPFFPGMETIFRGKMTLKLEAEKLEREKSLMQYHHLRNQVNPHFLFNTLTSLDGLIVSDPELASQFVRHLSKCTAMFWSIRKTKWCRCKQNWILYSITLPYCK